MSNEISCINKIERHNPHERITHIGGKNIDGSSWKITQADAIKRIEDGRNAFHVVKNGKAVKVIVAVSRYGNKYIKTVADGEDPNNLLSLMECV
jgi:hypothetical protein